MTFQILFFLYVSLIPKIWTETSPVEVNLVVHQDGTGVVNGDYADQEDQGLKGVNGGENRASLLAKINSVPTAVLKQEIENRGLPELTSQDAGGDSAAVKQNAEAEVPLKTGSDYAWPPCRPWFC